MRLAVFSDVHANYAALDAVIKHARKQGCNAFAFLGDAVGYGAEPNECVEIISALGCHAVAGNHDHAAVGLQDSGHFNVYAHQAIEWTAGVLTQAATRVMLSWPASSSISLESGDGLLLVHSTPVDPLAWRYLTSPLACLPYFPGFEERVCVVGHSHVPFIAALSAEEVLSEHRDAVEFVEGSRYIINVGSVGQPRDRDPSACYLIMDDTGARFERVEYDVAYTQAAMRRAGLPQFLIERLSYGM